MLNLGGRLLMEVTGMRIICTITLAGLIGLIASAQSSTWQQVRDKLDEYEKWARQRSFVWQVEALTVLDAQELKAAMEGTNAVNRHESLARFAKSLAGKSEYSVQRTWILTINNTSKCSHWKAEILSSSVGESDVCEVFYYENFSIRISKHNDAKDIIILPNTIYEGIPTLLEGNLITRCHPAFVALVNPLKCTVLVRTFYNQEPSLLRQWDYVKPKQVGHLLKLSAKDSLFSVEWVLDGRYDYRPVSFVLKSNNGNFVINYFVKEFKNIGGYYVPNEIIYMENIGKNRAEWHIKLKSVHSNTPIEFPISKGSTVTDLRLTDYINESTLNKALEAQVGYIWQGNLPTKEELKRIGYRHGYLLPPAVPHRRFSLWLFAPAVLFFTAAAYLYWKQKRR